MSINLKMLRIQRGVTLEDLAREAELTKSYLSKVERGLSVPSISTALRISQALDVPVDVLFKQEVSPTNVSITRRASKRTKTEATRFIAGAASGQKMVAFLLLPGLEDPPRPGPSSHHNGEELLYVLKGKIELRLADRREILGAGDCAHYNSTIPHSITSLSGPDAQMLVVVCPESGASLKKKLAAKRATSRVSARATLPVSLPST